MDTIYIHTVENGYTVENLFPCQKFVCKTKEEVLEIVGAMLDDEMIKHRKELNEDCANLNLEE